MTWLACATAGLVFTALRQSPARAAVACGAAHANLSQNPGTSPALRMSSAVEDTFVATIGNYASEAPGRGPWDEVCSPKMQWWSLLALADLFVINRPHTRQ
jgi:hypothetical protein